jgi:hypothetical protein
MGWTFLQAAGGAAVASQAVGFGFGVADVAVVAGCAAALVPATMVARIVFRRASAKRHAGETDFKDYVRGDEVRWND